MSFSPGPKDGQAFSIGRKESCDVVLPELRGVSRLHCTITFDPNRRLILRDSSKSGTVVDYNGEETKIFNAHAILEDESISSVTIRIGDITFRIVTIAQENIDAYNSNVDLFLKHAAQETIRMCELDLHTTASTAAPSGAQTPSSRPIFIKGQTLGKGAFAIATRYWNNSTGISYVYKEPRHQSNKAFRALKAEGDLLSRVQHVHVVELIEAQDSRLVLEYIPGGDLYSRTFQYDECLQILRQGLSALKYVHEQEIVHRDLKPNNILLQSNDPIHIKIVDFGLSKAGSDLKTFCGTKRYLAPEAYKIGTYTEKVDIWSFAVVIFEITYTLPETDGRESDAEWCDKVVAAAEFHDSDALLQFLLSDMLVIAPERRHKAKHCYNNAIKIPQALTRTPRPSATERQNSTAVLGSSFWTLFNDDLSPTPTQNRYAGERDVLAPSSPWLDAGLIAAANSTIQPASNVIDTWQATTSVVWTESEAATVEAIIAAQDNTEPPNATLNEDGNGLKISGPVMGGQTYVLNSERHDLSWIGSSACTVTAPKVDEEHKNERLRKSSRDKPDNKNEARRRSQRNRVSKVTVPRQRAHREGSTLQTPKRTSNVK